MRSQTTHGFTLIELMLVVALIGILAAIAVPNFMFFACKTKQAEAKAVLHAIHVAEEVYRGEHDTYLAAAPADIHIIGNTGVEVKGTKQRYVYSIPGLPPPARLNSYTAIAVGTGEMTGDEWSMTERLDITNTLNSCMSD